MSSNVGPSDAERYGWPGAGEGPLSLNANRIARGLARSGTKVIGFLPVDGRVSPPERLAPMLVRIAEALLGFVTGSVAVIDAWRTWPWGEAAAVGEAAVHRVSVIRPRVLGIAPIPCGDPLAASVALRSALEARSDEIAIVLVNLAGYSAGGTVPAAVDAMDGVVLVATAGQTLQSGVASLSRLLPPGKELGAILVG